MEDRQRTTPPLWASEGRGVFWNRWFLTTRDGAAIAPVLTFGGVVWCLGFRWQGTSVISAGCSRFSYRWFRNTLSAAAVPKVLLALNLHGSAGLAGCRLPVARCQVPGARCRVPVVSGQWSVVSGQWSVVSVGSQ